MDHLARLDVSGMLAAYRDGRLTPHKVVGAALTRIDRLDGKVNAIVLAMREDALRRAEESARRWREGRARPLEGVPFGLKDTIDIAGVRTTAGSKVYLDRVPDSTAVVVERLVEAGAIPLTKDSTTEFAVGGPHNPAFGAVRNPWSLDRWSGGSSAGSAAAVAARYVPMAVGSDGGGSVRIPASWCGLAGLKPTAGRIPRTGVVPTSWTTGALGPLARSVRDVALMFEVMAGYDARDARSETRVVEPYSLLTGEVSGMRVGIAREWFAEGCDSAVLANYEAVVAMLGDLGAEIVEVTIPSAKLGHELGYQVLFTEAASLYEIDRARFADYDPVTLRRLAQGRLTSARDYLLAMRFRHELQLEFQRAFELADVIVTPTTPATACRLDDLTVDIDGERVSLYQAQAKATAICNFTGLPALAVPSGFTGDGLPTSMQVIGQPFDEASCLQVGVAVQNNTDHHTRIPDLVA